MIYYLLDSDHVTDVDIIRILCDADPALVRDPVITSNPESDQHFSLALHLAIENACARFNSYDIVLYLLRLYPEAANIKNGHGETPYDIAKKLHLEPYYLRLLLKTVPSQDENEYHRLNWEARRLGMFLAYRAITKIRKSTIFAELRFENKDLLRCVISFL